MDRAVVPYLDDTSVRDLRLAVVDDRADLLERLDMRHIIRLRGVRFAVDHPVAPLRGLPPRPGCRVRGVAVGRGEQGLGRDAADVRAAAPDPAPVDDRDAGAPVARLERRRLAGGTGADDHEVELVHLASRAAQRDSAAVPATLA